MVHLDTPWQKDVQRRTGEASSVGNQRFQDTLFVGFMGLVGMHARR